MKKALILLPILALFLLAACGPAVPAETPVPTETPAPVESPVAVETDNAWLETLPWEEPWTCFLLGSCELEPEEGKEGLHALFYAYDWQLTETEAKLADTYTYPARKGIVYWGEGEVLRFYLTPDGEIYLDGCLYKPLGEGLREGWVALRETGVYIYAPPPLTAASGEQEVTRWASDDYWVYYTRLGEFYTSMGDSFMDFREADWFSLDTPVLPAEGEVSLSFAGPEPDEMRLYLFSPLGDLSLEVREGRFTPLAGRRAYALECRWAEREQGGSGSCRYILLIDAPEDLAGDTAEQPDLRLTVTAADRYSCAAALENGTTRPFDPEETGLLRRNTAGGWDWVQPIRPVEGSTAPTVQQGKSRAWSWDWSCAYGPLEPGEYCLQLRGSLGFSAVRTEPVFLRGTFTVTGEEPDYPGPLTLCGLPEGLESSMEALSPHRWVQTITLRGEGWGISANWFLFRLTETGELMYIPPAYRLQERLNGQSFLSKGYTIDLAAQYGALEAGSYVLRRRILRYDWKEVQDRAWFTSWLEVPEERTQYADTVFTLPSPLSDVPLEVSTVENSFFREGAYNGEESVFPVSFAGSEFSPWDAILRMKGLDFGQTIQSEAYDLYFQFQGEWFPLDRTRLYSVNRKAFCLLPVGESAELYINLSGPYGELSPGLYRLLLSSTVFEVDEDKAPKAGGPLVCQFRIFEDGTGVLDELTPEAS